MRTPEEKLLDPKPGSKIAEARNFGIDLTLIVENMRISPEQRLRKLQAAMISLDKLKREAAKNGIDERTIPEANAPNKP